MSFYAISPYQNTSGFVPSRYSAPAFGYGATDNSAAGTDNRADGSTPSGFTLSSETLTSIVSGAASGVTDSLADPRTTVAVLKAKIANYETMKAKIPAMAWWYDNEIAKMRAKLRAAKAKLALLEEGEDATRSWRFLGQTGTVVGIGVGLAAFIALLSFSRKR